MSLHPYTSKQLADERRRDMLAQAQHQSLVRQVSAEPRSTQQLTQRLRLRLRTILRPRPAAQA
jgi:hypothetical protein